MKYFLQTPDGAYVIDDKGAIAQNQPETTLMAFESANTAYRHSQHYPEALVVMPVTR